MKKIFSTVLILISSVLSLKAQALVALPESPVVSSMNRYEAFHDVVMKTIQNPRRSLPGWVVLKSGARVFTLNSDMSFAEVRASGGKKIPSGQVVHLGNAYLALSADGVLMQKFGGSFRPVSKLQTMRFDSMSEPVTLLTFF